MTREVQGGVLEKCKSCDTRESKCWINLRDLNSFLGENAGHGEMESLETIPTERTVTALG